MDPNTFPTKGNLIAVKNSPGLAHMNYGLMDKKRNILIRELMELIDGAKRIQFEIDSTFRTACAAPQEANVELGTNYIQKIGASVSVDDRVKIKARSIMGTEIPLVQHKSRSLTLAYGFHNTTESPDGVKCHFEKVKELTIKLSVVEDSTYRLVNSIRETQKRANVLRNIAIPYYEDLSKSISNVLEEKEREEFTRPEVIKRNKEKVWEVFIYAFDDLVEVIAELRSSEGCLWDREQTFKDLKRCLSDGTQKVFQAIDNDDMENLCKELGDVLLQVILNSQITGKEGRFTTNGVIDGLCRKMVRRHLHVFGGIKVSPVEEGTTLWDQIRI